MNTVKKYFFLILWFSACQPCFAQKQKIDSLQNIIATTNNDTVLVNAYVAWDNLIYATNRNLDFNLNKKIETICNAHLKKKESARLRYFYQRQLASAYNNIGAVHFYHTNYADALTNYFAALKINKRIKNRKGISDNYNNIGIIYNRQKNYDKALEILQASLAIEKNELKNLHGVANAYHNIGVLYWRQNQMENALKNYNLALAIDEKEKNIDGIASNTNSIAIIYKEQKKYPEALKLYLKALHLWQQGGDVYGIGQSYNNLGRIYTSLKNYPLASSYLVKSLSMAIKEKDKDLIQKSYYSLAQLDSAAGNYKSSFNNLKLAALYEDSINNQEITKKSTQLQMQYEFDAQQAADSIRNIKRAEQIQIHHAQEIKQQKIYAYGGLAGFLLMVIVALISFRAYKQKKKSTAAIEYQKLLVEEKQKEIMDSIHYAKRIQTALLPSAKYIEKWLRKNNRL